MRQRVRKLVGAAAILLTLWLIWSRLHIVVFVHIRWWGVLMIAAVVFLLIDYTLAQIFD